MPKSCKKRQSNISKIGIGIAAYLSIVYTNTYTTKQVYFFRNRPKSIYLLPAWTFCWYIVFFYLVASFLGGVQPTTKMTSQEISMQYCEPKQTTYPSPPSIHTLTYTAGSGDLLQKITLNFRQVSSMYYLFKFICRYDGAKLSAKKLK